MSQDQVSNRTSQPLESLEDWDEFLRLRYPKSPSDQPQPTEKADTNSADFQATDPEKQRNEFRNYEAEARPTVREFYRLNHRYQTHDFGREKRDEYLQLDKRVLGVWEAAEDLNRLVDDSDPDTDLSQLEHLLQTSEHIRSDGRPDWFVLAGFIHDLGKVLCLWGEPQWAVVGDTFPTGCAFSPAIVYSEFFAENPDSQNDEYASELGVYERNCGLDKVQISWGHDEYIYQVTKDYLPIEAQYMLRYHSFYAWHREGAYDYLTCEQDRQMLKWVQAFNEYDLYTKSHQPPDVDALKPYYQDLISKYFPAQINW